MRGRLKKKLIFPWMSKAHRREWVKARAVLIEQAQRTESVFWNAYQGEFPPDRNIASDPVDLTIAACEAAAVCLNAMPKERIIFNAADIYW